MGIVGAVLVARWSAGLLRSASRVLLDHQGPAPVRRTIIQRLASLPGVTVTDLHLWQIGPGIYSLVLSVATRDPQPPDYYKRHLADLTSLVHVTVEVQPEA
jgi:Co/Zn/Cd efflux system component